MERWAVRKRIRQLYRLLLDSRVALEKASEQVCDRAMKDLLFIMACRRRIMLNLLDRELGTMAVHVEPSPSADEHFGALLANTTGAEREAELLQVCQAEETDLLKQLQHLKFQPGVRERTRMLLREVIREVEDSLSDLRFVSVHSGSLRA